MREKRDTLEIAACCKDMAIARALPQEWCSLVGAHTHTHTYAHAVAQEANDAPKNGVCAMNMSVDMA